MKTIKYIRVSTIDQNTERQEDFKGITLIDKCSGAIPFRERKNGSKVFKMAQIGEFDMLNVHSIDRLGRNTIDILTTIQDLTKMGINVVAEKEGLSTLINGKENPTAKLVINILATISEFERNLIRERQLEGIANAKEKGIYKANGGNKPKETIEEFLNKKKNAKCLRELTNGNSIRRSASIAGVSTTTAQKIKKIFNEELN